MKMSLNIGCIHFIGIGGIGMSGIAEALHILGYKIQGSDQVENSNVIRLRQKGIKIFIGHHVKHVEEADVVVVSTAVQATNIELKRARERRIPIVKRAEMLAELMRFRQSIAIGGTHGKTTTTSIIATLLNEGKYDPTVINGGIINAYGTNAYIGKGNWMVVEADESDGTFLNLPTDIAVVTNIDPEHLDFYHNYDNVIAAFKRFIENIPFYGLAVLCNDHPIVRDLASKIVDRRIVTYGFDDSADVVCTNYMVQSGRTIFDVLIKPRKRKGNIELKSLELPLPGKYNISNALAAIVVAYTIGVSEAAIRRGLKNFSGVKRRFTLTGSWRGVNFYDDYAHHPVEIAAVLEAARDSCSGRVILIMQPHRYSRLANLFEEFVNCMNLADIIIVTPVYEAGEEVIEGMNSINLVNRIHDQGKKETYHLKNLEEIIDFLQCNSKADDLVLCVGAGNITSWSYELPIELNKRYNK
ncbi:UDP-N-acetylmuramate--L-alanine ligase [Bartonella sp. DGB1]|uniref:UDP-N-acetylmuramate--L-alanine ligase n=1 Tax=Bartonella sp. DGB1 TaxID=3239807 RepID=UPI00352415B1